MADLAQEMADAKTREDARKTAHIRDTLPLSGRQRRTLGVAFRPGWAEFTYEGCRFMISPGFPSFFRGYHSWDITSDRAGLIVRRVMSGNLYDGILVYIQDTLRADRARD